MSSKSRRVPYVTPTPRAKSTLRLPSRGLLIIPLVIAIALPIVSIIGPTTFLSGSEQTRECTVESIRSVAVRRRADYRVITTTECGDIRTSRGESIRVIDRDCRYNQIHVDSRYEMTSSGGFFVFPQYLVGPITLVHEPPGTECASDSWYIED